MPVALHVAEHGAPGAPTLVLLHGFPLDGQMWRAQVEPLVGAGYRVLVPDLRGHGRSGRGEGPATMAAMAEDVLRVLDERDVASFALCALSMGGYVAFEMLRHDPERVSARVLADTRPEADGTEAVEQRHKTARRVREDGARALAESMLPKMLSPSTAVRDPSLVAEVRGIIERQDAEGMAQALEGMAARRDMRDILQDVRVPTLVLVGAEDAITPPETARAMADALPDARLVVVPEAGHLAPLEQPRVVNEAMVPWLRERVRAPRVGAQRKES